MEENGSEPRVEVEEEEEQGWGDLFGEYMKELKEADSWTEWLGKVGGNWSEQWQVFRSAKMQMMLFDVEEQLKYTWKRQWRKAISGDPEKRVRDHMSHPEVQKRVKLYDTASFTLGVSMVMFSEYLLLMYPSVVPFFYLFTFSLLIALRYLTYHAIKYHFFLIDFCYLINVSTILQSLVCSGTTDDGLCSVWLKTNFIHSHGPIAIAILAWKNSLVFHSLDKMTSFYIHIMPGLMNYLVRWEIIPGASNHADLTLSFWTAIFLPCLVYCLWQAAYLYVQHKVIDQDPELVTSLRYVTQSPRNPMYKIVRDLCIKMGIFDQDEVYDSESLKTRLIFFIGQFIYMFICLLPTLFIFYFRGLNMTYLVLLILAATWRGGSYYVFQFTKMYNKKFDDKIQDKVQ